MGNVRLGVLGGTFDPIHYGHLRLAEEARCQLGMSRVLFIPSGNPPHKQNVPVTSAANRITMATLATASHPLFDVSSMEMDREGPSYTVDTLTDLHRQAGDGAQLFFIIGADAVLEMHTWKSPERVLELCQLVISARPGFDLTRLEAVPVPGLLEKTRIVQGPGTHLISSTDIRHRVCSGRSIRYLVPDTVERFIEKEASTGPEMGNSKGA